ncbi:MAG TPA: lamin tail domain-containing protein, partial [Burkholderiales bacterium]|nr:lamin tail domain-containing protein [Burkholderiales bacterium]
HLVINEILADPPNGRAGDANADGVRDASDDEFVEIVNTGTAPVCLAGWTLGDAHEAERHVFPLGAALPPGRALVVFGGGVPTGRFGGATVQWAAFNGRLNLSNAGDVLTLRDAGGTQVKQISWGDCAGARCASEHHTGDLGFEGSLVRWPELTGTWRAHDEVARSRFSPGVRTDGTVFR